MPSAGFVNPLPVPSCRAGGHLIFLEEVRHFLSHDGIIVLNGEYGYFFSQLGLFFRRELRLFWRVTHTLSIH